MNEGRRKKEEGRRKKGVYICGSGLNSKQATLRTISVLATRARIN
jgi:hypothetical protein